MALKPGVHAYSIRICLILVFVSAASNTPVLPPSSSKYKTWNPTSAKQWTADWKHAQHSSGQGQFLTAPTSDWRNEGSFKPKMCAVLVDAENSPCHAWNRIMDEVNAMGAQAIVRRAYADWTRPGANLDGWKYIAIQESLQLLNQLHTSRGKSSSDMALVIDAMDLLNQSPHLEGFVLITSDSDFTRLAQRLRESGKFVWGSVLLIPQIHVFLSVCFHCGFMCQAVVIHSY
jgi:hypothetical protein